MEHLLELGPIEQNIAKQAMRMGQPIPERIANAPELEEGLEFFIHAFFDLDTERSHGNGLVPIPWSSIKDYANVAGLDEEGTEDLLFHIRALDGEHLKRLERKQKAAVQNGKLKRSSK